MEKSVLLFLVVLLALAGCYEDKGDYDYKKLADLEIAEMNAFYALSAGDTLKISPEVTPSFPTETELKYRWTIGLDSVISQEKDLEYIIPAGASKELRVVLRVEDALSGLAFLKETMVRVVSLYSDGFLILSEKDGVSSLSFLKRKEGEWNQYLYDLYETVEGNALGGRPVQIHLHDLGNGTDQHLIVLQEEFEKCVDLDAANLKKSLELTKEFAVVPPQIRPKQAFFDDWYSFLLDEDGRIFARKNFSSEAFHTGYFSEYPLVFMDEIGGVEQPYQLNADRFVYDMSTESGFVFVYEKLKKRFLYIRGASSYGAIAKVRAAGYPNGFIPLENLGEHELIASSGYWTVDDWRFPLGGLYNILKKADGTYIGQMLLTDDPEDVQPVSQRTFRGEMMNDDILLLVPDNGSGRGFGCPYAFLASGNVLYYFAKDGEGEIVPHRYCGFDAKITAIEDEWYSNEYLCVGLENGDVYLVKINGEGLAATESERIVAHMDRNVGRVVQIVHKKAE